MLITALPTADQAAHAIVAACRIVGVDPLMIVSQRDGRTNADTIRLHKARSYAAIALLARFDCPKVSIGRMVGMGSTSASASMSILTRDVERGAYPWWRPEALAAVVEAIPGVRPAEDQPPADEEPVAEPEEPLDLPPFLPERREPSRQPTPAPAPSRAPPAAVAPRRVRDEPVLGRSWGGFQHRDVGPAPGKRAAYDMLREAVQNTAAMTPKE